MFCTKMDGMLCWDVAVSSGLHKPEVLSLRPELNAHQVILEKLLEP